jgi:hypothetical protein
MSTLELQAILNACTFRDWRFELIPIGDGHFVRVAFLAPDAKTSQMVMQYGRKWYLSPYMIASEVVQTVWKAVLTALEHEAREAFTYRDAPVFSPHLDVERLHRVARFQIQRPDQ